MTPPDTIEARQMWENDGTTILIVSDGSRLRNVILRYHGNPDCSMGALEAADLNVFLEYNYLGSI